ncbi:hypothetical protein GO986_17330 [Deinococcus sp. HMF7620]|uniref:DUF4013 domain-containing protein n=1 Tax=Deinococcus arboris TaxID=2682977 RepID=A0A7C9M8D6_9DEIO|nr:hypothetical protein [Deinococcus arboris]MVN88505.1 hypothetical protein [Deinococcus arboris]
MDTSSQLDRPVPASSPLPSKLRWSSAWLFPVATPQARAGVLTGALALLTLLPGWVLNLGYRWEVATRLYTGQSPAFPPLHWSHSVMRQGLIVCQVIALSVSPGTALALLGASAWRLGADLLALICWLAAGVLVLAAVLLVPAGMTRLGCEGDRMVFTAPWRLWRTVRQRLGVYACAWWITGSAIGVSLGVPVLLGSTWWPAVQRWAHASPFAGPGPFLEGFPLIAFLIIPLNLVFFFVLSVWAWQVAGYAFTVALYGAQPQRGQTTAPHA